MRVDKVTFKTIGDSRGWLVVAENGAQIPFLVKRIYYIYGVKDGKRRGFHAHKKLKQLLVCVSGKCTIMLTDGKTKEDIILDKPYEAIYIEDCIWREMYDFSDDAVLLVLASENYDENDYIRNYDEFIAYRNKIENN